MTATVTLREVRDEDLDTFFAHQQDDVAVQMAAFVSEDPSDRAAFDQHWQKIRAHEQILIRSIETDGSLVGHICSFVGFGDLELTYWIGREVWGEGIATAALDKFLEEQTERPIFARAAKDNVGSIRVLEKCGFEHVRDERGFANARGAEIDEVVYRRDS